MHDHYKVWPHIQQLLLSEFNHISRTGDIPTNYTLVHIKLLPKQNKDATLIANYRPVALINATLRLLSAILNRRLLTYLPSLIHVDQKGFIPNRSSETHVHKFKAVYDAMQSTGQSFTVNDQARVLIADF